MPYASSLFVPSHPAAIIIAKNDIVAPTRYAAKGSSTSTHRLIAVVSVRIVLFTGGLKYPDSRAAPLHYCLCWAQGSSPKILGELLPRKKGERRGLLVSKAVPLIPHPHPNHINCQDAGHLPPPQVPDQGQPRAHRLFGVPAALGHQLSHPPHLLRDRHNEAVRGEPDRLHTHKGRARRCIR